MMFQMVLPVSRDKLVITYALEELVELLLKLRIMMVNIFFVWPGSVLYSR